ncbi:hypothetical protein CRG98_014844 [Punica granatum]|uniref:Protein LONGIFOLIA 1 n=1 Tax=Punica granatum TaxID=22663 RepID=A0A2I0K8A6_PUNGR|nr:hypothetical protein CRG98_014844 [Punica granatum]
MVQDQSLEKQIEKHMGGCMAGLFHIFDRPHSFPAKRLVSPKRLPPSSPVDRAAGPPPDQYPRSSPLRDIRSPAREPSTPSEASSAAARSPFPFPLFELKGGTRSPWKCSREAPRLSLDSRATTDARGALDPRGNAAAQPADVPNAGDWLPGEENDRQGRSPSVIARLMGLDNLPRSDPEPAKNAELRRSASESRVNKDLYRFIEGNNFQQNQLQQQQSTVPSNVTRERVKIGDAKSRNVRVEQPVKVQHRGAGLGQRKSFYDSTDFFPEPTKRSALICEDIERRLRIRGIDEPSRDLETLKQILDALQLKGLLHSKRPIGGNVTRQRNFVYEKGFSDSPIVLMKPSRPSNRFDSKSGSDSQQSNFRSRPTLVRRSSPSAAREALPVTAASPRRDNGKGQSRGRAASTVSPTRSDSGAKSPSRRPVADAEQKRPVSPVQSPKIDLGIRQSNQTFTNRSPKIQKPVPDVYPAEDESSTVSESSISTPSQTDTERLKAEEYKDGRSLLERCDKLLHSIAEMTATAELQPSPVSVLDAASFYKDESSPSPVMMKRSMDFTKDHSDDLDDDLWSLISFKREESSDDADFVYISDILRASSYLPEDSDVFLLLEKQQYLKGKDTSKASRMQRRLIFDTIIEILERKRQLPPHWRTNSSALETPSVQQIWSEFQMIRDRDASEDDLFEVICGVLRKDLITMDALTGWGKCPVEVSESVLDIERLIFKDLISETIRDLAACGTEYTDKVQAPRRRLVF